MNYDEIPPKEVIQKTITALAPRGIRAGLFENKEDALSTLKNLIPAGAEIMTGSSTTLEQIGFINLLRSKQHPWKNLKDEILAEKDPQRQVELRIRSVASKYFIGSVNAVTHQGEVLIASASGSQLPAYAFTSKNVIWVVGAQKIVPNFEEGMKRIQEYCFPLEDQRMKKLGQGGSTLGKILIFNQEIIPSRKFTLIFVKEKLGF